MCEYKHDRIAVHCSYRVPKGSESEKICKNSKTNLDSCQSKFKNRESHFEVYSGFHRS